MKYPSFTPVSSPVSAFLVLVLITGAAALAAAQTETTLYSFMQFNGDGNYPEAGLVADSAGALYGTTFFGGHSAGVVYKMTPPANLGGAWTETVIYSFQGASGELAYCNLLINDQTGTLYGTTAGGGLYGAGVVFELTPPAQSGGAWTETVLHNFTGRGDGGSPYAGVIADTQGRLYGTAWNGGKNYVGAVYRLSPPSQSGGAWREEVLYSFAAHTGGSDGAGPSGGLVMDNSGALYGVTALGGGPDNRGIAFKLTPPASGVGPWSENILHSFTGGSDGGRPDASLILDSTGAFYGTTSEGGTGAPQCYLGCGTVFQLVPPSTQGGAWTENVLYTFANGKDGYKPINSLTFDGTGGLYGTTFGGGDHTGGTVFHLTPPLGGQGPWTKTVLYAFPNLTPGPGCDLDGSLLLAGGTLYGTAAQCGQQRVGAVFAITP
jgi:uncharacterized repeat protein (TIGR03803 family)